MKSSIRLDPFVLPSETNDRFILLVVAALALVFSIGTIITLPLIIFSGGVIEDYADIVSMLDPERSHPDEYLKVIENFLTKLHANIGYFIVGFIFPVVLLVIIFAVALIIYRLHSFSFRRRKGLILLTKDQDTKLVDIVYQLTDQIGVNSLKTIFLEPSSPKADAQVWGFPGNYYLRLGNKMRLLCRKQPETFKAIVLHELAHIANGDVFRTYFTQALWQSVLFCGIPILIIVFGLASLIWRQFIPIPPRAEMSNLESFPLPLTFALGAYIAGWLLPFWIVLFGVIAATRANILRTREVYADWRAAVWGSYQQLAKIFVSSKSKSQSFWRYSWRLHPTISERLVILEQPERLFQLSRFTFFFAGLLTPYLLFGLLLINIYLPYSYSIIQDIGAARSVIQKYQVIGFPNLYVPIDYVDFRLLTIILFGLGQLFFLSGSLGREVQRKALADSFSNKSGMQPYLHLGVYALIYTVGFSTTILSIFVILSLLSWSPFMSVMPGVLMTPILTLYIWLFLIYIYFFSRMIFFNYQGPIPPRSDARQLISVGTFMLVLMGLAMFAGPLINLLNMLSYLATNPGFERLGHAGQEILKTNPTLSMGNVAKQIPELQQLVTSISQQSMPTGAMVVISLIAILLVFVLFFSITYWMSRKTLIAGMSKCTYCEDLYEGNVFTLLNCPRCGHMLANWAFLQVSQTGIPESANLVKDYLVQAYTFRDMGQYGRAEKACKAALEIDPNNAETYNLLGIAYEHLGQKMLAQSSYEKAMELQVHWEGPKQNQRKLGIPFSSNKYSQPESASPKSITSESKGSNWVFYLIVSLIVRFLYPYLGGLISALTSIAISLVLAGGLAWLINHFVLSHSFVERRRIMNVSTALQCSQLLMIVFIRLLTPDLIAYPMIVYIFYMVIILLHILDPGLGPALLTLFVQIGLVIPILLFQSLMPLSVPLVGAIIIFITIIEYRKLQEFDQSRQFSHR